MSGEHAGLALPSGAARFVLEAGFIILVGAIAAMLDLSLLAIVIVMSLAWVVVALVERTAKSARPRRAPRPEVAALEQAEEQKIDVPEQPQLTQEERRPRFSESRQAVTAGLTSEPGSSREWNLWELERRAREHAGAEAVPEEWAAILMYLREFAKSDGVLPQQFDSLVRESFPELTQVG